MTGLKTTKLSCTALCYYILQLRGNGKFLRKGKVQTDVTQLSIMDNAHTHTHTHTHTHDKHTLGPCCFLMNPAICLRSKLWFLLMKGILFKFWDQHYPDRKPSHYKETL